MLGLWSVDSATAPGIERNNVRPPQRLQLGVACNEPYSRTDTGKVFRLGVSLGNGNMTAETLELIEQALDETLQELRQAQNKPARRKPSGPAWVYWVEDECTPDSEQILALSEMILAPVKSSLRNQLHAIGWLLFREVRSTQTMKEVAEWVAALDVEDYEFRISALDCAFEGVGEGEDVWRH
jgi:hypothetical protein